MNLNKPKFWDKKKITIFSVLLYPLSIIVIIFNFLKSFKKGKNFNLPIICVGNIYLGGTGKTPISIKIFDIFKNFGKKPAFVKKFYPYLKDEINLLEKKGKVFTHKSRKVSLMNLQDEGFDVAIMDDGFQDLSIKKDLSIVCFNENQWVGNGFVIPSGPLREKITSLKRAECVMINGNYNKLYDEYLLSFNNKLKIIYYKYKLVFSHEGVSKNVIAFSGIGNPSNFFLSLKENNFNIINKYSFPDHYEFNDKELNNLILEAKQKNAQLLTTEKDYYRINEKFKLKINFVNVEIQLADRSNLEHLFKKFI